MTPKCMTYQMKRHWSGSQKAYYIGSGENAKWVDSRLSMEEWEESWSESRQIKYYMSSLTGECVWDKGKAGGSTVFGKRLLYDDSPVVALRREALRNETLDRLVVLCSAHGPLLGTSKTARSCRKDGMRVGLQGFYSRVIWTQSLEQVRLFGDIGVRARDPVFPFRVLKDTAVIKELVDMGRSEKQAEGTYEAFARVLEQTTVSLLHLAEQERQRGQLVNHRIKVLVKGKPLHCDMQLDAHSMLTLEFGGQEYVMRGDYLAKLLRLYRRHTAADAAVTDNDFLRRVFCVVARYETLSGASDGYQMAFPSSGFQWLREHLGVTVECFASPLNVWNDRFCSIARDTDSFFGSLGNFFAFDGLVDNAVGGSFEANPPFVESVMEHMARKIELLLTMYRSSEIPWSFAVIVPGWDDDSCVSYKIMSNSIFCRPRINFKLVLEAREHNYRPGMQQREIRDEQASNVNTFVFFLQNDAGARRWPVTVDKTDSLRSLLMMEARNTQHYK